MKKQIPGLFLIAFALLWAALPVQAGVIRAAGDGISKGSAAVAHTTTDAAGAAVDGVANAAQATGDAAGSAAESVASAGKTTGSAIGTGAVAVGKGAAATPGLAYRGTKAAARKVWKAVW